MKSLYLRIYATVVLVLLLFAFGSGWILQRQLDEERGRTDSIVSERVGAWADLIQRSLPGADAATEAQGEALRDWSQRLRIPLALDDAAGRRIAASESFTRRNADGLLRPLPIRLDDGRTLWTFRPRELRQLSGGGRPGRGSDDVRLGWLPRWLPPGLSGGAGLVLVLVVLFVAVAAGAYPVVRRLTRRLEALKLGVEQFGTGRLDHRVAVSGSDEIAAVASSFNVAAARVEALVQTHRSLLANASHELRSPLARMKMAVSLLDDANPGQRDKLKKEIERNVGELDALVEEVLLASRLDASQDLLRLERFDLLVLAAEEASRVGASVDAPDALALVADERLLRRALRNLLENARRYGGGGEVALILRAAQPAGSGLVRLQVCDRGAGVPPSMRERIFEPFFRLPGHAEQAGGVGLGLSLVKQIAERHGGQVRCEAREGGGSCFTIELPAHPPGAAAGGDRG